MVTANVVAVVIVVVLKVIGRSTKVNRVWIFPGQAASRPQAVGRSWRSRNPRLMRPEAGCINLVDFDFLLYFSLPPFLVFFFLLICLFVYFVTWLFTFFFSVNCSHLASIISLCHANEGKPGFGQVSYQAGNSALNLVMGAIWGILKDIWP